MTDTTGTPGDFAPVDNFLSAQGVSHRAILGAVILGFGTMGATWMIAPSLSTNADIHRKVAAAPIIHGKAAAAPMKVALADPYGTLALAPYSFDSDSIANIAGSAPEVPAEMEPFPPPAAARPVASVVPPPKPAPELAKSMPLPPSRPPLSYPWAHQRSLRSFARRATPRVAAAKAVSPAPDDRNFFQKLFDMPQQPAGPALAYAQPEDDSFGRLSTRNRSTVLPPRDQFTAIYDVQGHTVYMPDGERLEAHSGIGKMLDNPRYVNEKGRGATPPHTYELTLRKGLFHGVQALRLNPVGSGNMYGRTGLLAHTYMLGPNGNSNGCVSFRHYSKFLHAFLKGEVKRLVVVGHLG